MTKRLSPFEATVECIPQRKSWLRLLPKATYADGGTQQYTKACAPYRKVQKEKKTAKNEIKRNK